MAEKIQKLSEAQIKEGLKSLPEWSVREQKLHRVYQFKNFVEAFSFMAGAALVAESMNHHPDWSNVYRTVSVDLSTHDAGGITARDLELAGKMEALARRN